MDPLDIITNLERVLPVFQPIFSADEQKVIGYEVFARFEMDQGLQSLGAFFEDDSIPEEYRIEVDDLVLRKAISLYKDSNQDTLLFINRNINLLMIDHGEAFLEILIEMLGENNLAKIVLEVCESNYQGDIEQLVHMLQYLKTYGIKIAMDKVEVYNQIDRISQLAPHILKINLETYMQSGAAPQSQILYSLSMLARKIGANLLFENIETGYHLQYAWKNGGRYYQGYYLAKPTPVFVDRDMHKDTFKAEYHQFISNEKEKLEKTYDITTTMQTKLTELLDKYKHVQNYSDLLEILAKETKQIFFRLYICDADGFQVSPNLFKITTGWYSQKEYIGKNWSWRPYFLENILKMRREGKAILSDVYSDLETTESIRTFSYPLRRDYYLFMDISHDFLYENNLLFD